MGCCTCHARKADVLVRGYGGYNTSDGLHLTPEGNGLVYKEVIRVFNEVGISADNMPYDFPHHSEIDGNNPESAFQQKCI